MKCSDGLLRATTAVVENQCGEPERRRGRYSGRVLLVSASHADREMYADHLRLEGFCVIEHQSASEAFDIARAVLLRAIVTEVQLSGTDDGLRLTRRLKEDSALSRLPVVVLTGLVFGSVLEESRAAGCDVFLLKPCSPQGLCAALHALPRRGAYSRTLQAPPASRWEDAAAHLMGGPLATNTADREAHMKAASALIHTPVLSADAGDKLGTVSDVLLDGTTVVGLVIGGGLFSSEKVLPFDGVQVIGKDVVLARSADRLVDSHEWSERRIETVRSNTLKNKKVITSAGREIGGLKDFHFDERSGQIEAYEIGGSGFNGLFRRQSPIPQSANVTLGPDAIVIPEPMSSDIQS